MARVVDIDPFLDGCKDESSIIVDTRSPGEYLHAHIPGAVNLPLLDNEQRAQIGTTFKRQGREAAILKGFDLVGPSFGEFIRKAKSFGPRKLFIYCWRGGLRSNIMAWVLGMGGFEITLLKGGYKRYRNWVLEILNKDRSYLILGGRTGAGKTEILQAMAKHAAVVDLEKLACHRGSAFGQLGLPPQPGNEYYENLLAEAFAAFPHDAPVWLENESTNIGAVMIPRALYNAIRISPMIEIERSHHGRIKRILSEYGGFPVADLSAAMQRIRKRLGEVRMKEAMEMLEQGRMEEWCAAMLVYYDKMYAFGMETRNAENVRSVEVTDLDANDAALKILEKAKTFFRQPA